MLKLRETPSFDYYSNILLEVSLFELKYKGRCELFSFQGIVNYVLYLANLENVILEFEKYQKLQMS